MSNRKRNKKTLALLDSYGLCRLVRRLSQWAWEAHLQPCSLREAAKKEPGTLVTIYQYDAAACCRALDAKDSSPDDMDRATVYAVVVALHKQAEKETWQAGDHYADGFVGFMQAAMAFAERFKAYADKRIDPNSHTHCWPYFVEENLGAVVQELQLLPRLNDVDEVCMERVLRTLQSIEEGAFALLPLPEDSQAHKEYIRQNATLIVQDVLKCLGLEVGKPFQVNSQELMNKIGEALRERVVEGTLQSEAAQILKDGINVVPGKHPDSINMVPSNLYTAAFLAAKMYGLQEPDLPLPEHVTEVPLKNAQGDVVMFISGVDDNKKAIVGRLCAPVEHITVTLNVDKNS